jgi:hypothetical protein
MTIEAMLRMHMRSDILPNAVSVSRTWIEQVIIVGRKRRFIGDGPRSRGSVPPTPCSNFMTGPPKTFSSSDCQAVVPLTPTNQLGSTPECCLCAHTPVPHLRRSDYLVCQQLLVATK